VNASAPAPATPSGMIPPHLKASAQMGGNPARKTRGPQPGSPALKRIFDEAFEGILVIDFWAAYDGILGGLYQCCLFHLLNEMVKVDQRNLAEEWQAFARKTKRLIQDALRLRARADFTPERYASRC